MMDTDESNAEPSVATPQVNEPWDQAHDFNPSSDESAYTDTKLGWVRWMGNELTHLTGRFLTRRLPCILKGHTPTDPPNWPTRDDLFYCARCGKPITEDGGGRQ